MNHYTFLSSLKEDHHAQTQAASPQARNGWRFGSTHQGNEKIEEWSCGGGE